MLQQTFNTLIYAAIYALFAMGYALVFGVLDILNLAHGAIFMIGSFAAVQTVLGWHWSLWLALPFGMLVGGLVGVLLDLVAVAPLQARQAGFLTPLISTIGAGIVFENIALAGFGPDPTGFPLGTFPEAQINIGDATVRPVQIFIVATAVLVMAALTLGLRSTRLGKAIRAVAANRLAAGLMGVDVRMIRWTCCRSSKRSFATAPAMMASISRRRPSATSRSATALAPTRPRLRTSRLP